MSAPIHDETRAVTVVIHKVIHSNIHRVCRSRRNANTAILTPSGLSRRRSYWPRLPSFRQTWRTRHGACQCASALGALEDPLSDRAGDLTVRLPAAILPNLSPLHLFSQGPRPVSTSRAAFVGCDPYGPEGVNTILIGRGKWMVVAPMNIDARSGRRRKYVAGPSAANVAARI